jgi:hypothetical protein
MKNLSRSLFLWLSATALSAMLYFFAFHFFPQTFPIINLNITMDLEQALEDAKTIAEKYKFGPADYQNAAMFHTDNGTKTFIELEAGGKEAVVAMMNDSLYMPYTWQVRHFKEHEKNECKIAFTPDGKPYSFIETLSENTPGAHLSEKEAQKIAANTATSNWNINFTNYTLVEASQKTEISKRIDHTFVYERTDKKIGEGTYRLKIVVSGDKVTELNHFIKVPEAFTRRYAEMRSANTMIALMATLIILLLYVFGGSLFGLYWIIRRRWHLYKQALLCGLTLGLLTVLTSANQLPFLWMQYNSAVSTNSFLGQLLLMLLVSFIAQTAAYTLIIAAAESLTRRAFGNHPQLWSVFSIENSASTAIAGRTVGAYLLVGFNVAFAIGFYFFSIRYLGWWSPSEMLFDPNILATYAPWFSPIAMSLNAGFIEECLFRAIPLAGAALLGTHFGKRNWWIAAAFILQAIVFGAAHANYPVQPSYARLIELLIPSFIFGAIYLRFGLLTSIIAHVVYDIIWLSIPIFISHATDAFAYKAIIIIITCLPLLRIAYAYLRTRALIELSPTALNVAWQPSELTETSEEEVIAPQHNMPTSSYSQKLIFIFGILGLVAWVCSTRFTHDGITIAVDQNQAINRANALLAEKDSTLAAPWKTLPLIFTHYKTVPQIATQHQFIWKKGKQDLYHNLLGTYLEPAHWTIRYAQFDTDIIQRTEEHKIMLYNDSILRYYHQLPESAAGKTLTQQEARAIAHKTIQEQFRLDPAQLIEVSATQGQLPNRTNWLFVFSDTAAYPLEIGQARISVAIAGDKVIDTARTIHVPEEWERKEQNKQNTLNIILIIFYLIFIFALIMGLIIASRQKRNVAFSKQLFLLFFGASTMITIIDVINAWPSIVGAFNTSLPLQNQLIQFFASLFVTTLIRSMCYGMILSYVLSFKMHYATVKQNLTTFITGICSGLFVAGLINGARMLIPVNMPLWPSYDVLGCSLPMLASLSAAITYYLQCTVSWSLLFMIFDIATAQWQKNRLIFTIIAALCGLSMLDLPSLKLLPLWIIVGAALGYILLSMYRHVLRFNYAIISLATGSYVILQCIQQGIFNAYPQAWLASIINVCAVGIASMTWYWYVSKENQQ